MRDTANTALVVCGPAIPVAATMERLEQVDAGVVIAADVGLRAALAIGRDVDVLVGDLDSLSAEEVAAAVDRGTRIERHDRDKDATDLELALECARTRGVDRIVVVDGGIGERVDHFIANLLALARAELAGCEVRAVSGSSWVSVIRGAPHATELTGPSGSIVSLLAIGGSASGVTTEGLRWELVDGCLEVGSSLGVSNEFVADRASVRVGSGCVVAIQPLGGAR